MIDTSASISKEANVWLRKSKRLDFLRHYCASIQHALGIPDAYIMQRGGWNSDAVLKQVYRHALSDRAVQMNAIANEHFQNFAT